MISRDIYICKGMSVICQINCIGGITWPKHAHARSEIWTVKTDRQHQCYSFQIYTRATLAKRSIRN